VLIRWKTAKYAEIVRLFPAVSLSRFRLRQCAPSGQSMSDNNHQPGLHQ